MLFVMSRVRTRASTSPATPIMSDLVGKLLITLTTTHRRIALVHKVLESICCQSRPADEIHLFVSKEGYLRDEGIREIPPELLRVAKVNDVRIHYVPNTGPYRKLLPILKERWQDDVT